MNTPLLFGVAAALAMLVGAMAVTRHQPRGLAVIETLVCLSAGFMLALAIGAAVPEAIARHPSAAPAVVLLGYLLVHFSQHTFTPHFHFGEETHSISQRTARAALAGLLLHTFFDGVAIASGFLVNRPLGLLFFAAIALHKLPEGVTVSSLVLASGGTTRRSYTAVVTMGLTTVVGVLLTTELRALAEYGLALSAGVTIYVAASNLVPEFQHKRGWRTPLAFFAGAVLFLVTQRVLERVLGG